MSPLSGYTYDLSYLGRSREVVNEYVTCGMLSSMKYPTGLITNFEYEPHAVQNGSNSTLQKEQVVLGVAYYKTFFGMKMKMRICMRILKWLLLH